MTARHVPYSTTKDATGPDLVASGKREMNRAVVEAP
jgi:hypothetical protein